MIKHVAKKLGPLRSKVVFLGGSATGQNGKNIYSANRNLDFILDILKLLNIYFFM
jgi:hypothetical protein